MEEMAVFKSFLRGLLRQLKELKKAIDKEDLEASKKLIEELIEDTQKGIEDQRKGTGGRSIQSRPLHKKDYKKTI